jgi:hypothetical protein
MRETKKMLAYRDRRNWRGWMGIEPTQDASQRPANGFEDRGRHQPPNIPSATLD